MKPKFAWTNPPPGFVVNSMVAIDPLPGVVAPVYLQTRQGDADTQDVPEDNVPEEDQHEDHLHPRPRKT